MKAALPKGSKSKGSAKRKPAAGVTLRDHFAGCAIQGIVGARAMIYYGNSGQTTGQTSELAEEAYRMADHMLAARKADGLLERLAARERVLVAAIEAHLNAREESGGVFRTDALLRSALEDK